MSAKRLADDLIDRLRATQLTVCNEAADAISAMDQQRRAFLGEIKRLRAENLALHEQLAAIQSPEVCAAAHDDVTDCGYCQRDRLHAEVGRLTKERDEWASKWHTVRGELAELKYPGMKGIIRPMDGKALERSK